MAHKYTRKELIDIVRGGVTSPQPITEQNADGSPHYYVAVSDGLRIDCGSNKEYMLDMAETLKQL